MVNFASCQKNQKNDKINNTEIIKDEFNLEKHTFFRVTETDSGKILFKPCDASIENYKFYKDSIYHNLGQEYDIIKKLSFVKSYDNYIFKGLNNNTKENELIQVTRINVDDYYLKINNEIFIDSLFIKKIPLVKESCNDEENDISLEDILSTKSWSNDCKLDDSYVYFSSVGGQFVFRGKFSFNTKIKKTNKNEFDVLFDNSFLKRPYPNNMNDYQDYSGIEPIAKMKKNGNKIEFIWNGFYNTKTNKRIHLENPFTNKIETKPILLMECEN